GKRLNAYGSLTCQHSTVLSRFRPQESGSTLKNVPMGTAIGLSVLNINCAVPNGPVHVTVQPGNLDILLVDDGTGNDIAAEDGVYSAAWVPPHERDYTLTFPDGSTWQAKVLSAYNPAEEVSFRWWDLTGIAGTNLNLSANSVGTISPPFSIPFGGTAPGFRTLYVNSKGS